MIFNFGSYQNYKKNPVQVARIIFCFYSLEQSRFIPGNRDLNGKIEKVNVKLISI